MDPIMKIRELYDDLTKAEQRVARYITEDPTVILGQNLTGIAQNSNSSNAAVIRMCQKLGYDGFAEFKFSLNRYLISQGPESEGRPEAGDTAGDRSPVDKILDTYIRYIRMIPEYVSAETLRALAEDICRARHIDIWGINRTAQSARQLSSRLSRLGIYNKMTDDWVSMHDDAATLTEGDLCILMSVKGNGSTAYPQLLSELKQRRCTSWVITMDPKQKFAGNASHVITLPWVSRESKTNFYENQIIIYLFIELLLYEVGKLFPG